MERSGVGVVSATAPGGAGGSGGGVPLTVVDRVACDWQLGLMFDDATLAEQVSRESWAAMLVAYGEAEGLRGEDADAARVRGDLAKRAADRFYGRVEGICAMLAARLGGDVRESDVLAAVIARCVSGGVL